MSEVSNQPSREEVFARYAVAEAGPANGTPSAESTNTATESAPTQNEAGETPEVVSETNEVAAENASQTGDQGESDATDESQPEGEASASAEESESEDETDDTTQPLEKRMSRWERRIRKLNEKAAQAERRAMEAELALHRFTQQQTQPQAQQQAQQVQQPKAGPPNVEDFETYGEYTAAVAKYEARQLLMETQLENQRQQALTSYEQRLAAFKKTAPDFDRVFQSVPVEVQQMVPPVAAQVMLESQFGPHVAYYLAKNVGEMQRIFSQPQHRALMDLAVLEQRFKEKFSGQPQSKTNGATPRPSPPKKPPSTVEAGAAPATKTIYETSNYAEFKKMREAGKRR